MKALPAKDANGRNGWEGAVGEWNPQSDCDMLEGMRSKSMGRTGLNHYSKRFKRINSGMQVCMQEGLVHSLSFLNLLMYATESLQLDTPGPYEGQHWRDNIDLVPK